MQDIMTILRDGKYLFSKQYGNYVRKIKMSPSYLAQLAKWQEDQKLPIDTLDLWGVKIEIDYTEGATIELSDERNG